MTQYKRAANTVVFHVVVCAIGFVMIYPLIWMFFSSFKESSLVLSTVDELFPREWRFDNYAKGWSGFGGTTFTTFFKNSLIVTIISVVGNGLPPPWQPMGFPESALGKGLLFHLYDDYHDGAKPGAGGAPIYHF